MRIIMATNICQVAGCRVFLFSCLAAVRDATPARSRILCDNYVFLGIKFILLLGLIFHKDRLLPGNNGHSACIPTIISILVHSLWEQHVSAPLQPQNRQDSASETCRIALYFF